MTSGRRWMVIGGLLATTLAAAAWVHNAPDDADSEVIAAVPAAKERTTPAGSSQPDSSRRSASQNGARAATPHLNLDKLNSRSPGELVRDPFAVPAPKAAKSGRTGASPRALATPPPPPSAPAVPFTYMGKLRSGPDTAVFLTQGDRNLVLREGDTIDSVYRVEQIADSAITLVYLPLGERQTILIGEPP